MSIDFIIQCHDGTEERLDRDELIEQMADAYRDDLQDEVEDRVGVFESDLYELSDEALAKEVQERTGDVVRIEESEEE